MHRGLPLLPVFATLVSSCATRSVERYYFDSDGVPTYQARDRLEPWEDAEAKAVDLMRHYCPDGDPEFVHGSVLTEEVRGSQLSVVFTCNHLIEGE